MSVSLDTAFNGQPFVEHGVVQGYESTYNLDGYIDEVRITKGVARYAGAFTPPSAPYPDSVAGDANFNSVVLLTHFNYATTTKGAASAIADLRSAALLQGAILATSTTTTSITTGIPLSASITAVSSYVATLSTGHSLEAEILNVVDGVADLTTAIPLASAVVAVVSAGATLLAPFFIASISVSTEASASLSTGIRLRGTLVSSPSYNAHPITCD